MGSSSVFFVDSVDEFTAQVACLPTRAIALGVYRFRDSGIIDTDLFCSDFSHSRALVTPGSDTCRVLQYRIHLSSFRFILATCEALLTLPSTESFSQVGLGVGPRFEDNVKALLREGTYRQRFREVSRGCHPLPVRRPRGYSRSGSGICRVRTPFRASSWRQRFQTHGKHNAASFKDFSKLLRTFIKYITFE
ncbi:hypothetical protein A9K55_008884 [Cordyceps militaris]|uniref:Uncharacterized protein n=1 Tax=Cordyceps militaris TaxID=73501 RepID=A0A2H4SEB2_CORMI|nr:hypothetical protein A9K55_008884 [Cordyceps militaris]